MAARRIEFSTQAHQLHSTGTAEIIYQDEHRSLATDDTQVNPLTSSPTPDELAAYAAGTLPLARFEAIDAWLAVQPLTEQERLLGGEAALQDIAPPDLFAGTFSGERSINRFALRGTLGIGGMGIVELVYDRLLEREVALKRCRGRAPDEAPASHALRLRLFRREATITARLEHPGIPPIHDIGSGPAGEPAYILKRLAGQTLSVRGILPAASAAELLIRVADAVGFAHQHGIVHRDLKPDHIWLGNAGEIHVIDWGLAGAIGSTLAANGTLGTPPWSAPEQLAETPADPRMDVWALGALLRFVLTGHPPNHGAMSKRGLGVIATRCLQHDPALRYPDGAAVAADIRQWLRDGLAAVERGSALTRTTVFIQRHRVAVVSAVFALSLSGIMLTSTLWARHTASERARLLLESPLPEAQGLRQWHAELATLPTTAEVRRAIERVDNALETETVLATARRYQRFGPWPTEITDLTAALQAAGIDPQAKDASDRLRTHVNRAALLRVLVHLQRALLVGRKNSPLITKIPAVIAAAAPDPAWASLADLLTRPILRSHDLELCQCDASEAALHQADTADILLALYAPDTRLEKLALKRIAEDPGAFWPHIIAGRAALQAERFNDVHDHALIALGADSGSLWPHLLLAYVALAANDATALTAETTQGLAINPDHLELQALRAVSMARNGHLDQAQLLVNNLQEAPHFQHHLQHRMGHPMERTVDALVAAGIVFPDVTPAPGPVVRPR